jgi:hypothetical protein
MAPTDIGFRATARRSGPSRSGGSADATAGDIGGTASGA